MGKTLQQFLLTDSLNKLYETNQFMEVNQTSQDY